MVPKRNRTGRGGGSGRGGGGNRPIRNKRMGRAAADKRTIERMTKNKKRARVFKRSDSEDSRRRGSRDDSPRGRSESRGGPQDFFKKRPRPGPKPRTGPWGGQSRKSFDRYEKKFWRESPDSNKERKHPRENDYQSDGSFDNNPKGISKRHNKKLGGGKHRLGRDDSGNERDPTQSELEAAYESFEENEEVRLQRIQMGQTKKLSDQQCK